MGGGGGEFKFVEKIPSSLALAILLVQILSHLILLDVFAKFVDCRRPDAA
jgi:hypothetical protein